LEFHRFVVPFPEQVYTTFPAVCLISMGRPFPMDTGGKPGISTI